ncbi:MAG: metallophosphoesterase family protein [Thermomicrobiales bacterium]
MSAPHRIAILSDLHGNSIATEAVLADIDRVGVDATSCLGDLVGYGPFPNETIDLIRHRDIPTIVGNYDDGVGFDRDDCGCAYKDETERDRGQQSLMWTRAVVTNERKAYLRSLQSEIRLKVDGIRLRLVHGSPRRMNEYLFEDRGGASLERIAVMADCDVLLFGHTHIPWSRTIGGVQMINTGSVGKPKDGDPRAGWALLEIGSGPQMSVTMHRVPYDIETVAMAIREADGLPDHYARDIEHGGANR